MYDTEAATCTHMKKYKHRYVKDGTMHDQYGMAHMLAK
jgi:hypothetical protein